ncbi:MAG: GNAT family N-acetyltransferase [Planctomycetales bacterium]|nr:GNAT family N-acetyltransferase [Planctomycetales bacterium]
MNAIRNELPKEFLAACEVIDHASPEVRALAGKLKGKHADDSVIARHCFEWVRDHIQHSLDFQRSELTCRASNVLEKRTGFCYAKSHLLAALLRANDIPAGFCYQRLTVERDQPPHCLHGLNAVFLKGHGWYRIDARGNKPGVDAQFSPPSERLAFSTSYDGEADFPEVWARPLPIVVEALQSHSDVQSLSDHLPDLTIRQMKTLRTELLFQLAHGIARTDSKGTAAQVRIRPVGPNDLPVLYEFQLDAEANQMAFTHPRSVADFNVHWAKALDAPSVVVRAIVADGALAGSISCFECNGHHHVGYWIGKEFWGNGIATRALDLLLDEVSIRPLYARVAVANAASLRVLAKCGFKEIRRECSPATRRFVECEEAVMRLGE